MKCITKQKLHKIICNFFVQMKHMKKSITSQFGEDPFAENAQGTARKDS